MIVTENGREAGGTVMWVNGIAIAVSSFQKEIGIMIEGDVSGEEEIVHH